MPPKPYEPSPAEFALAEAMTVDMWAQLDTQKAGRPASPGPTGHAHTVLPYADRPLQPAHDLAADRAADTLDLDVILPPADPELSDRRATKLGAKIIIAAEKAHILERRPKVIRRVGELMLLHTSWPGINKYNNPLRPTTLSERYTAGRLDSLATKSRVAANRRSHYRRTDNGLPGLEPMMRHRPNYTYGGHPLIGKLEASQLDFKRPPPPKPEPKLSASESRYKSKLRRNSEDTVIRRVLRLTPEVKAAKFDKMMNSEDRIGRHIAAKARRQRSKVERLTRKYTGDTGHTTAHATGVSTLDLSAVSPTKRRRKNRYGLLDKLDTWLDHRLNQSVNGNDERAVQELSKLLEHSRREAAARAAAPAVELFDHETAAHPKYIE